MTVSIGREKGEAGRGVARAVTREVGEWQYGA